VASARIGVPGARCADPSPHIVVLQDLAGRVRTIGVPVEALAHPNGSDKLAHHTSP